MPVEGGMPQLDRLLVDINTDKAKANLSLYEQLTSWVSGVTNRSAIKRAKKAQAAATVASTAYSVGSVASDTSKLALPVAHATVDGMLGPLGMVLDVVSGWYGIHDHASHVLKKDDLTPLLKAGTPGAKNSTDLYGCSCGHCYDVLDYLLARQSKKIETTTPLPSLVSAGLSLHNTFTDKSVDRRLELAKQLVNSAMPMADVAPTRERSTRTAGNTGLGLAKSTIANTKVLSVGAPKSVYIPQSIANNNAAFGSNNSNNNINNINHIEADVPEIGDDLEVNILRPGCRKAQAIIAILFDEHDQGRKYHKTIAAIVSSDGPYRVASVFP